jgi:hypothetical protein
MLAPNSEAAIIFDVLSFSTCVGIGFKDWVEM